MKLVIVPAALDELQAAANFYASHASRALADAFISEFERAAHLILSNPQLGPVWRNSRHRFALRRFPYHLIYQITLDELRIVAVAHQKRRPGYWRTRK